MRSVQKIISEAFVIGVMTVVMAHLVSLIIRPYLKITLPEACGTWNKYHVMETTLFLTGFLLHVILEYSGMNEKWCKNNFS